MTAEPKPPVKGELLPCPFCGAPASYSETRDNLTHFQLVCGNYNRIDRCNLQSVMSRHVPHDMADKTRNEIVAAWNARSGTYIPADDFGRILEVVKIGHKYYRDRQKCKRTHIDDAFENVLALARKYGSAE